MGLCTEFGPHIQPDCGEAMVAGLASCSCPSCHVVCTGKFAGCAGVWARGPQPVVLRRSTPALGTPAHRSSAGSGNGALTNGAAGANGSAHRHGPPLSLAPGPDAPSTPATGASASVAQALLAEMRALSAHLDEANSTWVSEGGNEGTEAVAARLVAEFQLLPERIGEAMGAALEEQHRQIMEDIRDALKSAVATMQAGRPINEGPSHRLRR